MSVSMFHSIFFAVGLGMTGLCGGRNSGAGGGAPRGATGGATGGAVGGGAASAASVFTLRRTRPSAPRPYRAWGYPVLPALYIAGLGLIIANTLYTRPLESIAGLALIGTGIPVFYYFKRTWVRG